MRSSISDVRKARMIGIDRLFAAEHARDVGGAFGLQFVERLDRIEAGVRRDDHIVAAEQRRILGQRFGRHHVERGAADLAGIERGDQRRLVDQRPARGVHDVGALLHLGEAAAFIRPRVAGSSGACTET